MTAIQQTERTSFGAARLYATNSSGQRFLYAEMSNLSVQFKQDLKEYYSEKTFAAGVANGHTSIDLTAEHYKLSLATIATDWGLSAPSASTDATVMDEPGTIPATSTYTVTVANAAQMIANTDVVYVTHTASNGDLYDVLYTRTSGAPAAGISYSVAAGVFTFAAGDASLPVKITYDYTNTAGSLITLSNVFQNSGTPYKMRMIKQDTSPIDGSKGLFIVTLNAVRAGGLTLPSKENEWNVYKREMKAFADQSGTVATFQFISI